MRIDLRAQRLVERFSKIFVCVTVNLTLPVVASAHAKLVQSQPKANEALTAMPRVIELRFSEPLEPGLNTIEVRDQAGNYRDRHLGPEMKEMKITKYALSDIRVKVSGNTAWATFKYAIAADLGTRHIESAGLGTAVVEKRGDDWRIVHWHSSAPRRAPTPTATPAKN